VEPVFLRQILTGALSTRTARPQDDIILRTLAKMLAHVEPPGCQWKAKRTSD
jgi:hypothetical protein